MSQIGKFTNIPCPSCKEERLKTALGSGNEATGKKPELVLYCQNCHYTTEMQS